MNAVEFVKKYGWEEAKDVPNHVAWCEKSYCTKLKHGCIKNDHDCCVDVDDLKSLVDSYELVESVGGLEIAKKITFQKRLRNDKATHFIQHSENQKLIQLISRNQKKPESSIEFKKFEQAIADVEKCQ